MQFILPFFYAILFLVLIRRLKFFQGTLTGIQLSALFCIKMAAGITAYYIYRHYYSQSDALLFMEGSRNLFDQFFGRTASTEITGWNSSFDDSFYNSSRIMIVINFFIQCFSFNNVFVHIVFFCFFSFAGITALYKAFHKYFPEKRMALVIGLYLVPSVLFWTSGIYKEVIAILCVGFIIYLTDFGLAKSYSLKRIIALIGFVCLLFFLKIYILACLTPLLLINFIVSKTGERNYWIKYGICFVVFVFAFHLCSKISPQTNFYQLLADKQAKAISESEGGIFLEDAESFIRVSYKDSATLISAGPDLFFIKEGTPYLSWKLNNMKDTTYVIQNSGSLEPPVYKLVYRIKPANSAIRMSKMEPGFLGIVKRIPFAIATVFFQPTLFSIQNALALFSWLENMWLLLLITLMILFFNRTMIVKKEVFTFCLLFALFQFAMIGLTSPVVGAVVRYKVTALPFLFTICLLYADWDKILKKVSKNKD